MKKIWLVLLALAIVPAALGVSTKDDYQQLKTVTGYLNNGLLSTIDANGEEDITAIPGDKIEFVVKIYNNDTRQIPVRISGKIDEDICAIDDYTWQESVDSESSATTDKIVCKIPTSTDKGFYDLKLMFECKKYNSSNPDGWRINDSYQTCIKSRIYYITVEEEETTTTTTTPSSTAVILNNMSAACNAFMSSTETCFGYVDRSKTCADELSTVKEERGTYKQKSDDCLANFDRVNNEKMVLESENGNMKNLMGTMIQNATCANNMAAAINKARSDGSSKAWQTVLMIGGGGALIWWFMREQKRKKDTAESFAKDTGYGPFQ